MFGFPSHSFAQNPQNPNTMYVAGAWYPRKSYDNGKTWFRIGLGYLDHGYTTEIATDPLDSNVVYAGFSFDAEVIPYGMWRSADGGTTWEEKNKGFTELASIQKLITIPTDSFTTVVAVTRKSFYISHDGAELWEKRNNGLDEETISINTCSVDPNKPNIFYISAKQLYKTVDQGKNWLLIRDGTGGPFYFDVTISPFNSDDIYAGFSGSLYQSDNGGKDWTPFLNNALLVSISPGNPQLMVAERSSEANRGMRFSWDKGQSWEAMDTGWHGPEVWQIKFDGLDPNKVYVGTSESGIYSWIFNPSSVAEKFVRQYSPQYYLYQNHPNPFNAQTKIYFQLPNSDHVNIVVFNLLSQKICTLVDEEQPAGLHAVYWDGKNDSGCDVASGIYFYHLNAGMKNMVKKMSLLR